MNLKHTIQHASVVKCVVFSKNTKLVATGSRGYSQIFDATTNVNVATFPEEDTFFSTDVYAVCFSPDDRYLATGGSSFIINIWNIELKSIAKRLSGHKSPTYSLQYFSTGDCLMSKSGDTVRLWDVQSGSNRQLTSTGSTGSNYILDVALSSDEKLIAVSVGDDVLVLDSTNGSLIERLETSGDSNELSGYSNRCAFSPVGHKLISVGVGTDSWDLKVQGLGTDAMQVQAHTLTTLENIMIGGKGFMSGIYSVTWSPDGEWIMAGSNGAILCWNKDGGIQFQIVARHKLGF